MAQPFYRLTCGAAQGRWADHPLEAVAMMPGGTELPVALHLERFEFEGEPAVRLRVPTQQRDVETLTRQLEEALRFDTSTGLLKRAVFFEQATAQAAQTLKAGLRAIVYLGPDKLAALEGTLGTLAIEELMENVGQQLRSLLQPGDAAGRVSPRGFALLVERGNTRDLDAWIARVLQRMSEGVFHAGGRSVPITCSAGATLLCRSERRIGFARSTIREQIALSSSFRSYRPVRRRSAVFTASFVRHCCALAEAHRAISC